MSVWPKPKLAEAKFAYRGMSLIHTYHIRVAEADVKFVRLRKAKQTESAEPKSDTKGAKESALTSYQLFFNSNDKPFYFLIT